METRNLSPVEVQVLATLDIILTKIGQRLEQTFDPDNQNSIKLLREYRSTLHCRRTWAKEYSLLEDKDKNKEQHHASSTKKDDKKTAIQPALANKPSIDKRKPDLPPLDESIFKGIHFKKDPIPQPDMNSGLVCHR